MVLSEACRWDFVQALYETLSTVLALNRQSSKGAAIQLERVLCLKWGGSNVADATYAAHATAYLKTLRPRLQHQYDAATALVMLQTPPGQ